jgi:hypothetical protein
MINCAATVLHLIPDKLHWVDRQSIGDLLGQCSFSELEISEALELTIKEGWLTKVALNAPSHSSVVELISSLRSAQTAIEVAERLRSWRTGTAQGTTFYGPTPLWAGATGNVTLQTNIERYIMACYRQSVMLSMLCSIKRNDWRQVWRAKSTFHDYPSVRLASWGGTRIVTPVSDHLRNVRYWVEKLSRQEASYVLC